jgi:hypothetical protein
VEWASKVLVISVSPVQPPEGTNKGAKCRIGVSETENDQSDEQFIALLMGAI